MLSYLKGVLRHPALQLVDFRRLWISTSFNAIGMAGEQVIISFLIFEQTNSTIWVGISLAFYFGPMLLFGIPAGMMADWFDRRLLLPVIEGLIAVLLGGFGWVLVFGEVGPEQLLLMAFVCGALRAIYNPVRASYLYDVVGGERIVSGFGLINLGTRVGQLIGALLSGSLLHHWGPGFAFFSLSAAHAVAFVIVLGLVTPGLSLGTRSVSVVENLKEYWLELRTNQRLRALIFLTSAIEILGFSFATALPELATSKLMVGADGLGYLHAARAGGGILAGIYLAGALDLRQKGKAYLWVTFGFGLAVVALGSAPHFMFALFAVAAVAAMAASTDILSQSMMQLVVPDRLRGRAMGTWVFAVGVAPVGHLELGLLAVMAGADIALVLNGLLLLTVALFASTSALRHER